MPRRKPQWLAVKPLIIAATVMLGSWGAVTYWLDDVVERTLMGHADSSARIWRTEFTNSVPELERLLATGEVTPAQRRFIEASMAGSDIFRFELFDTTGRLVFISDKAAFEIEEAELFNETARDVVREGLSEIEIGDGRGNPERPDWYVEAYMPVTGSDGTTLGVVEVYVDVAGLASVLRAKLNGLTILLLGASALIYLVPTFLLITRNRQLRERDRALLNLSRLDPLTGLLNRGAFNELSGKLFDPRDSATGSIAVFFVDLDRFKEVNDTLGHDVGDSLLKHVAQALKRICGPDDILARLGGDEFVLLVPRADDDTIETRGERILSLMERPYLAGTKEIWPSFSVGVHLSPPDERERRALYRADLAVYKAKADGRGCVVRYSPALERIEDRRKFVANCIRTGLRKDLFFLEFQPVFDRAGRVAGFEALLRLNGPDGERITPSEFIPIAEDIGLISQLGSWTMRRAVNAAVNWPQHVFVAVNVSADEFKTGDLPETLAGILSECPIDPERVCLELTESTLIDHTDTITEQLADLKALGVQIALDDFGTGYSSLGYLWRYNFDRLKIDRSFLEGLEFDAPRYRRILESIVVLGHQLDMSVTVEGVESEDQMTTMTEIGCDFFQGFLMSRPIPEAEAGQLVATAMRA